MADDPQNPREPQIGEVIAVWGPPGLAMIVGKRSDGALIVSRIPKKEKDHA